MKITKAHGNGGKQTQELIKNIFVQNFKTDPLQQQDDAATLTINSQRIGTSIDGFVVKPYRFNGGDIGKLAVCGTVNDLAVCGYRPLYLNVSYMLEEGFALSELALLAASMADAANLAGIKIVAGDTKVVEKNNLDEIFVTTSGIGIPFDEHNMPDIGKIAPGNVVIVSGDIGRHGACIYSHNDTMGFAAAIASDCALLNHDIELLLSNCEVNFMRDLTRGGLATALNEIAQATGRDILLQENQIPVSNEVQGLCDILGLDAYYLACEGRFLAIAPEQSANKALAIMQKFNSQAAVIGKILPSNNRRVLVETAFGGTRIVDMLTYEMLPRIC